MLLYQRDEVRWSVGGQCRLGKMRVRREEIFRQAMEVGKVAAAAPGDQNFLADASGTFQHRHEFPALAGLDGAHEPGGPASEDDDIKLLVHFLQHRGDGSWCQGALSTWHSARRGTPHRGINRTDC